MNAFSPHTRGCSSPMPACHAMPAVFPAYAGMFRFETPALISLSKFSPHTRGCSWIRSAKTNQLRVFPAYAGMFPRGAPSADLAIGFPRIRGDVPYFWVTPRSLVTFSPHTRGCSPATGPAPQQGPVFPAYAGMFRSPISFSASLRSFPRIRGDVPSGPTPPAGGPLFSPHTRGCSSTLRKGTTMMWVFPAYAGMFLGL